MIWRPNKTDKKVENIGEHYFTRGYGDKELELKIFKIRLAHLSNIIDEKLFKQIFGHTFETLANKLINATNKEENQLSAILGKVKTNYTKKKKQVIIMWSNQGINVLI